MLPDMEVGEPEYLYSESIHASDDSLSSSRDVLQHPLDLGGMCSGGAVSEDPLDPPHIGVID